MSGLTAATRDGNGAVTIDAEAVEAFVAGHRGPCLTADDDGYDAARVIWNGSADTRPASIAQCGGAADVTPLLLGVAAWLLTTRIWRALLRGAPGVCSASQTRSPKTCMLHQSRPSGRIAWTSQRAETANNE